MDLILPLIFALIAFVSIGFAMYTRWKTPSEDTSGANAERLIQENAQLKAELAQKHKEIGQLTQDLQTEKSERDQLSGKGKQLFVEITTLKEKHESLAKEKDRIASELSHFQADEKRKTEDFTRKISQLEEARNALEDERKRIRREDEAREEQEKINRDRMWAEHEDVVKTQLTDLCKLPQYAFPMYDNKNLPEGFGGKFKPDFMIEFLGKYVIFDAKVSRSDNLQNYVTNNVKSTVEKINNDPKIYPMVFFIVPTEAFASLTKTRFFEQSYEFFIIPIEAVPAIFSALKKISAYELAEQLDPQDRDNIVNLIAEFDHHINMRNALDLIASQSGVSVLAKSRNLKKEIKDEIVMKKSTMRLQQFSPTEIKSLMIDAQVQQEEIDRLTSPQPAVSPDMLTSAKKISAKMEKKEGGDWASS